MDDMRTLQDFQQSKRIDQYKRFFTPTLADEQDDYYSQIRPLLGVELSTAFLDKEDIKSYYLTVKMVLELANNGLIELLMDTQSTMTSELKLTQSVEARVLDHIFSNRIEYSQTQTVHEHQHPVVQKRGLFSRGSPPQQGG